jgi:hypothetical protein
MNNPTETNGLDTASKSFLDAIATVIDLWHTYSPKIASTDEFSQVLLLIYQNLMLDLIPSFQLLVPKEKFYSCSILCRSLFDITIQLQWILSMNEEKRESAIRVFLDFDGIGKYKTGKVFHEWQKKIDPDYSTRKTAITLGLDQEAIPLPLASHENGKIDLTLFDYLSKITHWNPRTLKDLIGINSDNHLGYTLEYPKMAFIFFLVSLDCILTFTEIFIIHCFKIDRVVVKSKLSCIKENFTKSLTPSSDPLVSTDEA